MSGGTSPRRSGRNTPFPSPCSSAWKACFATCSRSTTPTTTSSASTPSPAA